MNPPVGWVLCACQHFFIFWLNVLRIVSPKSLGPGQKTFCICNEWAHTPANSVPRTVLRHWLHVWGAYATQAWFGQGVPVRKKLRLFLKKEGHLVPQLHRKGGSPWSHWRLNDEPQATRHHV